MKELYIIPSWSHIVENMQLCNEYGVAFEYNDFFSPQLLEDEDATWEKLCCYRALHRDTSADILHGAFLDVTVHSEDAQIRAVSERRVRKSMEIGATLGVRAVIFHTNCIPNLGQEAYRQHWLQSNESFWRQILHEYPEQEVLLENMFDQTPGLLATLAERLAGEERFGVCLNYANALTFGRMCGAAAWVDRLRPYTRHVHISDNDLQNDLHLAVGAGQVDWAAYDRYMRRSVQKCSVLVEVDGIEAQERSLAYMERNCIFPFCREEE